MTPQAALSRVLDGHFPTAVPARIGVAVSGGSDSVALLHLARDWCMARGTARGTPLWAATVDHGLRAAAAAEAAGVAQTCAALQVPHKTLTWRGWDGRGNLQAEARSARRRLLAEWAADHALDAVLLGHTADDQAETVLMRLARGSGVDGLSGMPVQDASGLFLRPLLEVSRAALRDWLAAQGLGWVEDPSNDDPRFDRVKARRLLTGLADLGLTPARLIETASHMARARVTLRQAAAQFAEAHLRAEAGDLLIGADALALGRSDTEARVLSAALQWIAGAPYRPRYDALVELALALRRGESRTLAGVQARALTGGGARLTREVAAAEGPVPCPTGRALWDGRWQVTGPADGEGRAGLQVAATGEAGLAQCPGWRDTGLPREALLAAPAVWDGARLVAAPLAGISNGWQASLRLPFHRFILSH